MRLSEKWFEFASGAAFQVIVVSCFKHWLLQPVRWWRNRCL